MIYLKTDTLTESTKIFSINPPQVQWSESKMHLICKKQALKIKIILDFTYPGRSEFCRAIQWENAEQDVQQDFLVPGGRILEMKHLGLIEKNSTLRFCKFVWEQRINRLIVVILLKCVQMLNHYVVCQLYEYFNLKKI